MSTDEYQGYIDYSDVVLLASIEEPREITNPDDLHDLHLLAAQELVSFGTTMQEGKAAEFFTIPTAKLTKYGKIVLDYMRSQMGDSVKRQLKEDVKDRRNKADKVLESL